MYYDDFGRSFSIQVDRKDGKLSTINSKRLGRKETGTFTIPFKGKKTDQNEKEIEHASPSVQVMVKMVECH
jgi:hypothetical protein